MPIRAIKGKKLAQNGRILPTEIDSILDAIHDDVLITDADGIVISVSSTFEKMYGLAREKAVGSSVYDLEKEGYFKPSITAIVIKTGEKITKVQKNKLDRDIVVTATPVRDEKGNLLRIVSFSRDITEFLNLKEQYSELENKMERYAQELNELRRGNSGIGSLIAKDNKSQSVLKTIQRVAPFDTNVLLTGESGVGKSFFAKIIHSYSSRKDGPFIEINCGAIPYNLLESELFGYESGSFTGAKKEGKIGLVELSQGGTLFLDEIAEMPMNLQVKLLRTIQSRKITRVGGIKEIEVDFRLVSATNKDLQEMMKERRFREDLYYRLNVISIEIPPLRERKEDIIPMVAFFLEQINNRYGIHKIISKEAYDDLAAYEWPGNIRELQNLLERMVLTTEKDIVLEQDLPHEIREGHKLTPAMADGEISSLTEAIEKLEGYYIRKAYEETGTTVGVAKQLNISQPTAVRKIKKYLIIK